MTTAAVTVEQYIKLVLMMYDAGLENALEAYREKYSDSVSGYHEEYIEACAKLDFGSVNSRIYQDLIELRYAGELGEGVLIDQHQVRQIMEHSDSGARDCYKIFAEAITPTGKSWVEVTQDNYFMYSLIDEVAYVLIHRDFDEIQDKDRFKGPIKINLEEASTRELVMLMSEVVSILKLRNLT